MATLKLIKNGVKKVSNRKRRRRNTATVKKNTTAVTKKVSNRKRRRRNTTKVANGIVKKVSNRRRRHHKRNGITKRSNGILGNSKETVYSVASLLTGLIAVKVESPIVTPLVSKVLGVANLGQYAKPITEAALALTVNKWAAGAVGRKMRIPNAEKMVVIGGLAMASMSLLELFLPQASSYNPFAMINGSPVALSPAIVNSDALNALASANNVTPATMGALMAYRRGNGYRRPVMGNRRLVV